MGLKASPRGVSLMPNHPCIRTPSVFPPACIVSYHPVLRFPGQFWHHIFGFGTRFASLWAHPLLMLTLSHPLLCSTFHFARNRFGCSFWFFRSIWLAIRLACSEALPYPSNRMRLRDAQAECVECVGVANVVQLFLVCDRSPGSTVDPGLGLVNGALFDDDDLATEDVEVIASGKASVTVTVYSCTCVCVCMRMCARRCWRLLPVDPRRNSVVLSGTFDAVA
eukprot:364218-Chlamydomonas_euryale.AAC.7